MRCFKCESDNWFETSANETIYHKEVPMTVNIGYTVCRDCGYEYITTDQILVNEARIEKERNKFDMTNNGN